MKKSNGKYKYKLSETQPVWYIIMHDWLNREFNQKIYTLNEYTQKLYTEIIHTEKLHTKYTH